MFLSMISNNSESIEPIKYMIDINLSEYSLKESESGKYIENEAGHIIDEFKYNLIIKIIRIMNGMSENDEIDAGNRVTAIDLVNKEIRRIKRNRSFSNVTTSSIISSIAWSDSSINILNIWDLTMYQLFDGLKRVNKRKDYDNLMRAYYTGNIKKEDINFRNVNWLSN